MGAITSERWAASDWNRWAAYVGSRTWVGRNRRFLRDVERLIASAEAFLYVASSVILLRRIARR